MDPTIRLEPARVSDARPIALMSRVLIEHGLPWRWRIDPLRRMVREPDTAVLVARKGSGLCGFAVMSFDWKRARSHLVLLAVDPAARRQGLGGALVRWLEVVAHRGSIARVSLEVRASSSGAQRLYEKLGYNEVGRVAGYYQGREDAVKMVRELRASATLPRRGA